MLGFCRVVNELKTVPVWVQRIHSLHIDLGQILLTILTS